MRYFSFSWLLFAVVSILVCLASAEDEAYRHHACSGANYTSNSIYQKNLNTLLSSLSSKNDIDYGFYNFSRGDGIDTVNVVALCRGDISQSACRSCVNFSTTDLLHRCPSQKEAIVWYDSCMLRYSNRSIFRSVEGFSFYMWNAETTPDVNQFTQTVSDLLFRLRNLASSGDSRRKFAFDHTDYVNVSTIYGLVQCTPDLTQIQCSNCLDSSFREIAKRIPGNLGGRFIGPSCHFRFEMYQFYEIPPPPPPAIASQPPTTANPISPTGTLFPR